MKNGTFLKDRAVMRANRSHFAEVNRGHFYGAAEKYPLISDIYDFIIYVGDFYPFSGDSPAGTGQRGKRRKTALDLLTTY